MNSKAVILFSGGQDSTTCLFWAQQTFDEVRALIIDYGQRHRIEIDQAEKIAALLGTPYQIVPFDAVKAFSSNSLTDPNTPADDAINPANNLPLSFVPGRNLGFLTLAAMYAYMHGFDNLVTGVCQTDYSGYPDCRQEFIDSAEQTIALAMDKPFKIHTPLMLQTKADTWRWIHELGGLEFLVEHSHTCYNGDRDHRHPWGYGCGECAACKLRKKGYDEAFGK